MKIIRVRFDRLDDQSVVDLAGAVGVYVIWAGKAVAKPTYIGEGSLLKRLGDHVGRFPQPWDGYVAITGDVGSPTAKRQAEIVEALLLEVADRVDRRPTANAARGKTNRIYPIFRSHGVLRVRVTGYDPLGIPWQGGRLKQPKVIRLEDVDRAGINISMQYSWRLRKRQGSV